tara:strand:+ start:1709 stop:2206 length:498 start_codon:yes stop_codon:yes gene_type:complete
MPEEEKMKITRRQLIQLIREEARSALESDRCRRLLEQAKEIACPTATQDLKLNTKNRNSAIRAKHIQYGPINLKDKTYWVKLAKFWKTKPAVAKKSNCSNCAAFDVSSRMEVCMPGETSDKDGKLGYCWMHNFKCHSARTCYTWAAGGPISEDNVSHDWQERKES